MTKLKAPFPYFGGKSRVAAEVWRRFGDNLTAYAEPFCGSAAVYFACPSPAKHETLNDADGLLVNFLRAVKHDPDAVAWHADRPRAECDLVACRNQTHADRGDMASLLKDDPDCFDAEMAGKWVFVMAAWKGRLESRDVVSVKKPATKAMGVHPLAVKNEIVSTMTALSERLFDTVLVCGGWQRACTASSLYCCPTQKKSKAGVFLDPPYSHTVGRDTTIYSEEMIDTREVGDWCRKYQDDPRYRIALCGYEGEYDLPGWSVFEWETTGGFSNTGTGRGTANRSRERIWFSPHCLNPEST